MSVESNHHTHTFASSLGRFVTYMVCGSVLFGLTTCITPVDIDTELEESLLVVEGFITNEPGPHKIRLSRLAKFGPTGDGGTIFPVHDALEVYITDNTGIRTDLILTEVIRKEIALGVLAIPPIPPRAIYYQVPDGYWTPETFSGEVGKSYQLHITTSSGERYVSRPDLLNPSPKIDSLIFEFKVLPSADPISRESGVDVLVRWEDPGEQSNFYSWKMNGTYFIETPITEFGDINCVFDPDDFCCDKCWIEEKDIDGNELAFSDQRFNGATITRKAGFILDDSFRFGNESVSGNELYYAEVEQYGISAEAFAFNRLLDSQRQIDGDIFDPPPANLRGNIVNENNPDEVVVGFFGAYSIHRKGAFIKRSMLEFVQRWQYPCGDCRIRGGATLETPEPYRN